MSYLTTPELPEFTKATISFWFKVSQAALDAAQKESDDWWAAWTPDGNQDQPPFLGLIPLVVFGKDGTSPTKDDEQGSTQEQTTSTTVTSTVMTFNDHLDLGAAYTYTINWFPDPNAGGTYTDTRSYYTTTWTHSPIPGKPIEPSYIAIDGGGNLRIKFESAKIGDVTMPDVVASATSKYYTQDSYDQCFTYSFLSDCSAGGDTVTAPFGLCGLLIVVFAMVGYRLLTAVADNLVITNASPREEHPSKRTFGAGVGDVGTGALYIQPPDMKSLAADTWHHVLVSVDMTGGSASTGRTFGETGDPNITATSLAYLAVDDVNYPTGNYPFQDTNKVYTGAAGTISGMGQAIDFDDQGNMTPQGPVPSYSLTDMSVPQAPVGIPATEKYADHIRKVEMAEFLFFTDLVVDTSVEANRRPFITAPDKNGYQHPSNFAPIYVPLRKFAAGDPATWEPGADNPAFAPPLFDPSIMPTGIKVDGAGKIADIDFTKCQWNWQMGLNLGKLKGKVKRTGKIRGEVPPVDEPPRIHAGG